MSGSWRLDSDTRRASGPGSPSRTSTPDISCVERPTAASLEPQPKGLAQKLSLRMRPPVPTSHPAFGLANATAQYPVTSGSGYQVMPSSGVQAAPPALAVTTTVRLP